MLLKNIKIFKPTFFKHIMTKISELQPGQGSVNIEVTVKSMEEPRTFNKYGKDLKVANAVVTDGESEIKLTLWNDDVDKVKTGAVIKIENGYVSEFQGEKQLTTGKFGKLEIAGESTSESPSEDPTASSAEEAKEETSEAESPSEGASAEDY
jgi:replication factor A1